MAVCGLMDENNNNNNLSDLLAEVEGSLQSPKPEEKKETPVDENPIPSRFGALPIEGVKAGEKPEEKDTFTPSWTPPSTAHKADAPADPAPSWASPVTEPKVDTTPSWNTTPVATEPKTGTTPSWNNTPAATEPKADTTPATPVVSTPPSYPAVTPAATPVASTLATPVPEAKPVAPAAVTPVPQSTPAWAAPTPAAAANNNKVVATPPPPPQQPYAPYGAMPYPYAYNPAAAAPPKKKGGGVVVLIIVLLIIGGLIAFGIWSLSNAMQSFQSTDVTVFPTEEYIGVIAVEGTIEATDPYAEALGYTGYNHNFTMDAVDQLINDSNNKGLILYVDSPGGTVFQTDELYLKLMEYKNTGRPIYAYFGTTACSGGYYIAMAADKIYINRSGMTGSIGVTMGVVVDATQYYQDQGLKLYPIHIGRNKAMGADYEEFTEEQEKIFMSLVQESYDLFVDIVATGRGKSVSEVTELADGRVYTPKQALSNGLVDKIGTYDDTINALISDNRLSSDITVYYVAYQPPPLITSLFVQQVLQQQPETDPAAALAEKACPVDGPAYYFDPYK